MIAFDIRPGRDSDSWDLIGLIAECWADYPGCVMDVNGEMPEMLAPATHYDGLGGRLWVAARMGRTVGSVALAPSPDAATVALQKLYVAHSARGKGLGSTLVDLVEDEARRRGAAAVEIWTDTRFETAHRLYQRVGYERDEATRELHDLSGSVEYRYWKDIRGDGADNQPTVDD